jgi:hypothetical protein
MSTDHWSTLADEADAMASYEESQGRFGGAYRNKAALYRRTVQANALEAKTGQPHCVCCLKPSGLRSANAQPEKGATQK